MTVALPSRLLTGALLGAIFIAVGFGTGTSAGGLLRPHTLGLGNLAWAPLVCLAVVYVQYVWRKGFHPDPVRRVRALPPRLQAVIFSGCLALGFVAGLVVFGALAQFS